MHLPEVTNHLKRAGSKEVPEKSPGNSGIPGGNASYLFKRAIGRFLYNRTVAFDTTCLRLNHCLTSFGVMTLIRHMNSFPRQLLTLR